MAEQLDIRVSDYIKYLRTDPIVASKELLCSAPERPLTFWWGQRSVLRSMFTCSFLMCVAGRGLGKSFMLAIYAILKALLFPRHRVGIISASFRQSKFVFSEIKRIYQYSPLLQAACSKPPVIGSDSCYLEFKDGSIIMALPLGDGETIRGARFHSLLCDEAVKVDQEILEVAIMPMMNVKKDPMIAVEREALRKRALASGLTLEDGLYEDGGNQIIFTTTAWFQFAELYKYYVDWKNNMLTAKQLGIKTNYAVFEFPYTAAPPGFLDMDYVMMTKATMSPVRFAMENLAFWPPDTDGFYPASIFETAKRIFPPKFKGDKDHYYVMAIDPARESDNFIISILELMPRGGPARLVYMESMGPKDFKTTDGFGEMHERIRVLYDAFPTTVRIMLDQGGGGLPLRDMLSKQHNFEYNGRVIQSPPLLQLKEQNPQHDEVARRERRALQIIDLVPFSTEWLNDAAWELKSKLEQQQLLLPTAPRDSLKEAQVEDKKLGGELVDVRDLIYEEIEKAIAECTNVIAEPLPTRKGFFRFTTATKTQKKDRWASLVLGAKGVADLEKEGRIIQLPISVSGVHVPEMPEISPQALIRQAGPHAHPSVVVGLNYHFDSDEQEVSGPDVRVDTGAAALG